MRHSIFALIGLSLALMLSLAACGGDKAEESAAETDPAVTEIQESEFQDTETGEAQDMESQDMDAQETGAESSVIVDLCNRLISENDVSDPMLLDLSALSTVYGLDPGMVKEAAGFTSMTGGVFPDEIVLVEAVDEAAAGEIQGQLSRRLTSIEEQAADYDPDSAALAQRCQVVAQGNYVGLFFTESYDNMVAAFQGTVG